MPSEHIQKSESAGRKIRIIGSEHLGEPPKPILDQAQHADVLTLESSPYSRIIAADDPNFEKSRSMKRYYYRLAEGRHPETTHFIERERKGRELTEYRQLLDQFDNMVFHQLRKADMQIAAHYLRDEISGILHAYRRDLKAAKRIARIAKTLKPGQTLVHVGGNGHVHLPTLVQKELIGNGIEVEHDYTLPGHTPFNQAIVEVLAPMLAGRKKLDPGKQLETEFVDFLQENKEAIERIAWNRAIYLHSIDCLNSAIEKHRTPNAVQKELTGITNWKNHLQKLMHGSETSQHVSQLYSAKTGGEYAVTLSTILDLHKDRLDEETHKSLNKLAEYIYYHFKNERWTPQTQ